MFTQPATPALFARRLIELGGAFIFVWIFRLGFRFTRFRSFRRLPGPPASSLIWGHEWDLYSTPPGELYARWAKEYGGVVQFDGCFGRTMLSVTDPRAVQYILEEDVYNWPKPEGARQWFLQLLGAGILYTEGEEPHKRQRHALAPALSAPAIRELVPGFFRMASRVCDAWADAIQRAPGDSTNIDAMYWANRLALDTIGLVGFAFDFDSLRGEELHPVAAALDALTNSSASFAAFVMKALVWQFPSILRMPSTKGKLIAKNREDLHEIAAKVWGDAMASGEDGDSGTTLLGRLIKEHRNVDPRERMSNEEIQDQISTLISAGYEPVSCTIAWALWELARNRTAQQTLRDTLPNAEPDFEHLHEMPYLDAVFRETLRLHPPILELHHVAGVEHALPLSTGGTVPVPRGTIVAIPVNAVQRDQDVWGPDAEQFVPERWLGKERPQGTMLAFSAGPRRCLGRTFAEAEIKALLVTLVRQFRFSVVKDVEAFQSFVIRPRVTGHTESTLPLRVSLVQSADA